ncbi:MAG: hypothetical protein WCT99_13445 [Bacteroidota bacterium]
MKKYILLSFNVIVFFIQLFIQKSDAQNRFDPLRYQTKGIVQWACLDSSQVYDYVLRLYPISEFRTDSTITLWKFVARNVNIEPNGMEFQFSITVSDPDTVIAIAYPFGGSVYHQVQDLLLKYPIANSSELAKHVMMVYDTIQINGVKELKEIVRDIAKMKYYVLLDDKFSFTVPTYEIYSQTYGGVIYFSIGSAGLGEDEERLSFTEWIDKTFNTIKTYSDRQRK